MSVTRNAFKLFVSIEDQFDPSSDIMKRHIGYPIDNVIQVKLSKSSFQALFKDTTNGLSSSTSVSERYNSSQLLARLQDFFDRTKYNNHNNMASDITILINNSYNDVDVNPVTLESACAKDGDVFNYFFKSTAMWNDGTSSTSIDNVDGTSYGGESTTSGASLRVYEVMGRELDNMISRNVLSTSEDGMTPDNSYDDLDDLYTKQSDNFWGNLQEGDSIFIEGSFLVPTANTTLTYNALDRASSSTEYSPVGSGNLPIIVQFVHSSNDAYSYTGA